MNQKKSQEKKVKKQKTNIDKERIALKKRTSKRYSIHINKG